MAGSDFEVDVRALVEAARGAAQTVQTYKDKDVIDLVPTNDMLGDEDLWVAVDEFQDRWDRGLNDMCEDISEVAGRLGKVAQAYLEFDERAKEAFGAIAPDLGALMRVEGPR